MMEETYIQFGCGLCAPPGWRNFDAGPIFWLQKHFPFLNPIFRRRNHPIYPVKLMEYSNVITGLPVRPQSAKGVYCSHVLEHLTLDEFRITLRNVFKYLESGGIFRIVVPDLEYMVKKYIASNEPEAASRFLEESILGEKKAKHHFSSLPKLLFGRSRHLWMWDYKAIEWELKQAGFVNIHRAYYNDSSDPRFKEVEDFGRWENCLGVECVRP